MTKGVITKINSDLKYGFINKHIFFRLINDLSVGDKVKFIKTVESRGLVAINISKI